MNPAGKRGSAVSPSVVTGCLWILMGGLLDWWTGPEAVVSVFYLPGVLWIAWSDGRRLGLATALFAAAVWLVVELDSSRDYSHPLIPFWNGFTRLIVFGVTAYLASEIRIRIRAERALDEQRAILESILDSMRDGVVVARNDGTIQVCNPTAARWFGGDAVGMTVLEWAERRLVGPETVTAASRVLRGAVETGEGTGELVVSRPSGGPERIVELRVQPLRDANEQKTGVVLVFSDLTERREMEREISRASERERRRIGQDLHDGICQELASIGFATDAVQMDLERLGMEKQARSLADVAKYIRRTNHRTKELSRGIYPAGLDESLEVALHSLAAAVTERSGARCDYLQPVPAPELGREVEGHLFLIVREAVVNAERHSGGENILIATGGSDHNFEISVSDDGSGLKNGSATHGIGLRIMKYRASLIGADLEFQPSPNGGTTVRCRVPVGISHPP